MLPSPFYAEGPTELGDDQTWVDDVTASHHRKGLADRPRTSPRVIVDGWVAAGALALVSRMRGQSTRWLGMARLLNGIVRMDVRAPGPSEARLFPGAQHTLGGRSDSPFGAARRQ